MKNLQQDNQSINDTRPKWYDMDSHFTSFSNKDEIIDHDQVYVLVFKNDQDEYMIANFRKQKFQQSLEIEESMFPDGIEEKYYSVNHFKNVHFQCNCCLTIINGVQVPKPSAYLSEEGIKNLLNPKNTH